MGYVNGGNGKLLDVVVVGGLYVVVSEEWGGFGVDWDEVGNGGGGSVVWVLLEGCGGEEEGDDDEGRMKISVGLYGCGWG